MTARPDTGEWTTEHMLHLFNQIESRPAAADHKGRRWMERRTTGLALAVCNCGYNTGWIPRDQMPSAGELLRRHGIPG